MTSQQTSGATAPTSEHPITPINPVDAAKHQQARLLKNNKRAAMMDGAASSVMESVATGYSTPFALALGASNAQIGFLSGITVLIGSLSQPFGADLVERIGDRRRIIVYSVIAQALLWLPIALVPFLLGKSENGVNAFIALFTLLTVFGSIGGPAWNSAMADVIPPTMRGEFFGKRNQLMRLTNIIALFAFGALLSAFGTPLLFYGFLAIFLVALASRLLSAKYLSAMEYPKYEHNRVSEGFITFVSNLRKTDFGKFALFIAAIVFSVNIASPFFHAYMLRDLNFPYYLYAAILAINAGVAILTFAYWGKLSDTFGNKKILFATGLLIPLIPAAYLLTTHPLGVAFAEAISGFAWAGFNLATFNYVLEFSPAYNRARYIAYYNVLIGSATFAGAMFGSYLASSNIGLFGLAGLPLVFLVSAVTRLISATIILAPVADSKPTPGLNNRRFFINAVLYYPMNGVRSSVVSGWSLMKTAEKKAETAIKHGFFTASKTAKKGSKAIKRRFYLEFDDE